MLTLTYEYKLKLTQQQAKRIDHDLEVCRQVRMPLTPASTCSAND
ncbi:hypothetical protein QYC30_02150 [Thermosynechococcus sp. JY1339]|nr:hypothetical protein [Thermosynechococcus sp. JY1339]WKT86755.1 hypothetical protein QYC30_02150 [Thermosynechococcus sp. JY1339]